MLHPRLLGGVNVLGWIVSTVLALTGWISHALGYILLAAMLPVTLWMFWPWLRRWRPLTLVPEQGASADGTYKAVSPPAEPKHDELKPRGIPEHMIAERHIRYHATPIRLAALLDLIGVDGAIMDFTFEHCVLEGPGIIAFRGPPPASERQNGISAHAMVGPTNCRVEGSPDTTLYEITPGSLKRLHGVIQLVGPTLRNVTFRNVGFAGTPEELQSLREQLTFSEGASNPSPDLANEERRRRIDHWRSVIRDFDFDSDRFAGTDTYSQMKPYLKPEVVKMFETPRAVHIGNEARGDTAYGYTLLDEVARIEREWGLS